MKILVVGATGKTGELAWRKAVAEGHDVTVFGRSVAKRYKDDPVRKMQGDVSVSYTHLTLPTKA